MRSMCVGVAETGVEHCSPAKNHKVTFIFSYFCVTKSTKSQQGGLAPSSFRTTGGVHELVARAMRGEYVRQRLMVQVVSFALPATSYYHACEHITRGSRADSCTHCLHARWIMGGGRESNMRADGTIKITLILLCSHTDAHPNLNREVCHSLTWHSSESESALERFEPVAVVQQLPDGRGTLFAPVAARRQKVFKRGIDTYAEHVCRRRRDGSQYFPLFVLFVLFGQAKRTLKEKKHKVTFRY